jgi:hypothetical protein
MRLYMMKRYMIPLFICLFLLSDIIIAQPDTVSSRTVAPGVIHTQYYISGPFRLDVLEIDITNEYISIESFRPNGLTRTTVQSDVNDREGHRVIGAINADFFSFETGWPIGNQVVNGKFVQGLPTIRSNMAVDVHGNPYIERLAFSGSVTEKGGDSHPVAGVNISRGSGAMVFYTDYRGATTGTAGGGAEVTVELIDGEEWLAGTTMKMVVTGSGGSNSLIPGNGGVISGASGAPATFITTHVSVGDTLDVKLGFGDDITDIVQVIAGGGRLLENGVNVTSQNPANEGISSSFMTARHPRTFAGFNADTTKVYFCTVDGRQTSSLGMSFNEMASFLQSINVSDAFNLDGGGSTTMVVRGEVTNSPSDPGGERSVANSLQVISTAPLGTLSHLYINPTEGAVYQGGTLQFSATGTDEFHNPIDLPVDVTWEVAPELGTINGDGLFTAAEVNAEGYVYIRWNEVADSAHVRVRSLYGVHLFPRNLVMVPGERVNLMVRGIDSDDEVVDVTHGNVVFRSDAGELEFGDAGLLTVTGFGYGTVTADVETISAESHFNSSGNDTTVVAEDFAEWRLWSVEAVGTTAELIRIAYTYDAETYLNWYDAQSGALIDMATVMPLAGRPDSLYLRVPEHNDNVSMQIHITDRDGDEFVLNQVSVVTRDNVRKTGFNLAEASGAGNPDFPVTIRKIRFSPAATGDGGISLLGLDAHYPHRNVDATVLWDFESGIGGWFTPQQTHGAQIHGVNVPASSLVWSNERAWKGNYSGHWTYVDDGTGTNWDVRITRGANQDLGRILRGSYVGAWVWVDGRTDLNLHIVIRDGGGQLEAGPPMPMNHVGWKQIGTRLDDALFTGYITGNGQLTGTGNQFNGFRLTGNGQTLLNQTRTFFIDHLVTSALTVPTGFHSFNAEWTGLHIELEWSVNSEMSVNRYVIERAADGGEYVDVGSIPAEGNADSTRTYNWTDSTPAPGSYDYRIRQITNDGAMTHSPGVNVIVTDTGTGEVSPSGYRFELHQNYPNPFNPTTTIRYSLAEPSNIRLTVWNLIGQRVATLVSTSQDAGTYAATFDASRLSSGMYFYTIEAISHDGTGNWTDTRKLMLIK